MNQYEKYVVGLKAKSDVVLWVKHTLKKELKRQQRSQSEVEHVLDYLMSSARPHKIGKMSYSQAHSNAKKWMEANQKKGRDLVDTPSDIESIHEFDDGFEIVKLISQDAYKREGL